MSSTTQRDVHVVNDGSVWSKSDRTAGHAAGRCDTDESVRSKQNLLFSSVLSGNNDKVHRLTRDVLMDSHLKPDIRDIRDVKG